MSILQIAQLLFYLFYVVLLKTFCDLFLRKKKEVLRYQVACQVLLTTIVFLVSYFLIPMYVSKITIAIISVGYCMYIYRGANFYKTLVSIMFQCIYTLYCISTISLIALILSLNEKVGYIYNALLIILYIFVSNAVLFITFKIVSYKKGNSKIKLVSSKSIVGMLCFAFALFLMIIDIIYKNIMLTGKRNLYILVFALTIFTILFIYLVEAVMSEKIKNSELYIQKQVLEMQKTDYDNRVKQNDEIKKIKHDMKNNLISIEALLREKKYEEAQAFVNTLSHTPGLTKIVDTGNPIIDGLLNVNMQKYPQIAFHLDLNNAQCVGIDYDKLASIFGNALNNAIEATLKTIEKYKDIYVSIKENEQHITIKIENNYKDPPVIDAGKIISSKESADDHGLGLLILEKAVKHYQGKVDYNIKEENRTFKIIILLIK